MASMTSASLFPFGGEKYFIITRKDDRLIRGLLAPLRIGEGHIPIEPILLYLYQVFDSRTGSVLCLTQSNGTEKHATEPSIDFKWG